MKWTMALAAAAVLVVPVPTAAQSAVGVRGGFTLTDISVEGAEEIEFESKTGFVVGGFAEFPLGETFDLQLGLSYTEKGGDAGGTEEAYGLDLVYLEVPVLAAWSLPSSGSLGARLMGGPVFSFEFSCERRGVGGPSGSVDCEPSGFETSSTDIGVQLGGGVVYRIRDAARLFFDAGYNLGLTNWRRDAPGDESAKNRALLFSAGVIFPLR